MVFCLLTYIVSSQTPAQFRAVASPQVTTQAGSALNPWQVGAKLSFAVRDLDGSLQDNFIFAGKASAILAQGENYAFPLYGSIGLGSRDLFSSESGFNLGLYPYYVISEGDKSRFLVHGGLGYKIVPAQDSLSEANSQFRLTAGIEAHFGKAGSLPTTISLAPLVLWNNNIEHTTGIEATLIVPVFDGAGLLVEFLQPFKKDFSSVLRIGMITTGSP